ncbi:DinB family protein [Pontibacillus halophilus]|uniref:DinB family protein n=1 Tax=Pontibacillus halophilus TaxID=516704 RepID=UPI001376E0C4|nr:DinB family protein [Pontibacillus halophilus]
MIVEFPLQNPTSDLEQIHAKSHDERYNRVEKREGGIVMNEEMVVKQLDMMRSVLLNEIKDIEETEADIIPNGFPNSLRWQLGHTYLSVEYLVFAKSGRTPVIPEDYPTLFGGGTHPDQWEVKGPSLHELRQQLTEQKERLLNDLKGSTSESLREPFQPGPYTFETVGEMLLFTLYHESEHIGLIKGLKRTIRHS